ncbi:malto-oligosyltrehalose trehalohydrolase [Ciceribacter sp. L1K23]|uniref:malto-oligosyltrehalose trehalohydrolase n=1 Tax=Ciceribacter sp. L1K23 TaxID=2820276 RepID=UPI001B81FF61|nr:malto-oligosyltrehalose trehalohydrolase [Ciceribacter sp. L1K23]MBR0557057.1 malto-oligosyltrehalose trehalohydrolase [Ciceribacter sp. L1K23]
MTLLVFKLPDLHQVPLFPEHPECLSAARGDGTSSVPSGYSPPPWRNKSMTAEQIKQNARSNPQPYTRRYAWGAEMIDGQRASFRLWAPRHDLIRLRLGDASMPMVRTLAGWHELETEAQPGETYCFVLSDGSEVADPASRRQAESVSGRSVVADLSYGWRYTEWTGRPWHEAIIYELHVGAFTSEGTFVAAIPHLQRLADQGFTAIEIMPVAAFDGQRGWGYDGVLQYAPHPAYGTPDDFRQLVDAAHGLGLMVFLDVVYNHFGHLGNDLERSTPEFFKAEGSPWGPAPDLSRPEVRRYFLDNALYWLREFRLDGLRLDAADCLVNDSGNPELLSEISREIRRQYSGRHIHLMIEDARNVAEPMRPGRDKGPLCKAEWNDDFHHVAHAIATGETGGFYVNFCDKPWQKLRRSLTEGFVYQGEARPQDGKVVGELSADLPPTAFINFLQNHDQIGNRVRGERLLNLAEPPIVKALTEILLLSPQTPLMFMGEEFATRRPFFFFSDHPEELHEQERRGRLEQAWLFQDMKGETVSDVPDPNAVETFLQSKIDHSATESRDAERWSSFVADLLDKRQRLIWPLHAQTKYRGAIGHETPDGLIAIDWRFGKSLLQMRANLTEEEATAPPVVSGELIYGQLPRDGILPAFSVLFSLANLL